MQTTYTVTGMTCDHCVNHVLEEDRAIPGVDAAELTLADAQLTVTSAEPIDFALIEAAADEAGEYGVLKAPERGLLT
jgi:copper chaperone CopZ